LYLKSWRGYGEEPCYQADILSGIVEYVFKNFALKFVNQLFSSQVSLIGG